MQRLTPQGLLGFWGQSQLSLGLHPSLPLGLDSGKGSADWGHSHPTSGNKQEGTCNS